MMSMVTYLFEDVIEVHSDDLDKVTHTDIIAAIVSHSVMHC